MKMKMKQGTGKKLRYGGVTAILTALIIAVIIVVNVMFSALSKKFLWYADLTAPELFTLSDNCIDLLKNGDEEFNSASTTEIIDAIRAEKKAEDPTFEDEDLMVRLIFCDTESAWEDSTMRLYVYQTAQQLEAAFPEYIRVEAHDILWNPSAVSKYEGVSSTAQVVIEFGTEYRVRNLDDFYEYEDDTKQTLWAYNGEKVLASSILSVTRAESPVAGIVTNHGEQMSEDLLKTLELAGFTLENINLSAMPDESYEGDVKDYNPIPKSCRLLVICNPTSDFLEVGERGDSSHLNEIDRLDDFLVGNVSGMRGSLMVFISSETRLDNLEDYLSEDWGVVFNRDAETGTPYRVIDESQSLDYEIGSTIRAEYVTESAGGELTKPMWEDIANPRPIIFKDAVPLSFSPLFVQDGGSASGSSPYGTVRSVYDVFVSGENAYATVEGQKVAQATAYNPLKLMTITMETEQQQENQMGDYVTNGSYVLACGSPEFASRALLQSTAYGNGAFLEHALRVVGQEVVPVNLTFKIFNDVSMDTVTTADATKYTVVLAVLPVIISLGAGIFVLVRRKNR